MEEKLIPLSEDVEKVSFDIRDTMYQNLLSKGVNGVIPSMDVEALAKLILTVPDRAGMNGWTLVPAISIDGDRCVFKIAGWLLNDGNPPPSNVYLGYTGLVTDIAEGINIRGRDGLTTSININGNTYTQINGSIFLPDLLPIDHNISITSHEDLRAAIAGIQSLLESDDTTLDELREIVAYIKENRDLIESVTIDKISYSDIVDNLSSTSSSKPLSANMGRDLANKINGKQDKGDYATNASVDQKISNIQLPDIGGAVGVHNASGSAHNDIRLLISGLENTKQDKGNYVLTNDARLTDSRNAKDVQPWAKATTKPTYTATEVGLGNVNNTADSAKNVLSATKLTTARTINGVSFNGTANITIADSTKANINLGNVTNADFLAKANSSGVSGGLSVEEKIANRSLWDGLKGYYVSTDTSNSNTIYERLYLTSGNVLKATLTTSFGTNITETLVVVGGVTITKVIEFSGNVIKESIS